MIPYASGKRWALYAGDCLDVLAAGLIPADAAIVADPPYGMGWDTDSTRFAGGQSGASRYLEQGRADWKPIEGDGRPFDPAPWLAFPRVALWGANHYAARLPVGTTLVWVKRAPHLYGSFLSDAEIGWCKGGYGVYCHEEQFPPPSRIAEGGLGNRVAHPTQKPVALLVWCMERAKVPADALVVDPYTGSASVGVAALTTGRSFIGIEREPAYLDIAARRLAQAESDGVQLSLVPRG